MLPGSLEGRNVAIVLLPGVQDDSAVEDQLKVAGATISGKVTLTQAFAASSQKTYRTALAGQVRDYVSNLADDASNDVIVASAVDMLLRSGTEDSQAKVLLGSLTSDDNAMLTVNTEISGSADAVVVIAPDTLYAQAADGATPTADAEADAEAAAQTALYASAVSAFADRGPTVSIGTATNDTDVLSVIRAQGKGSTVDSRGTVLAALNGAFAVGNEILGEHVALGTQAGATAALGTRSEAAAPAEPEQSTPETEAPASNEEGQG